MTLLTLLETLILLLAAIAVARGTRPAVPPHGRRLLWIWLLLALQIGALFAFLSIHYRTGWGMWHATPPGLAILTQLVRAALLMLAARAWFDIVSHGTDRLWPRLVLGAGFLALGLGTGGLRWMGALGLFFVFQRMKWAESLSGWRRALGFVLAAALLVGLTFVPVTTVVDHASRTVFRVASDHWPPPLLTGDVTAATELALARPFDRVVQAVTDVFRVQLLVLAIKFLFLPIRLSGMSLKRRFWFNFALVRTIPSLLSSLVFAVLLYLALGYSKGVRVRAALEETLARAGTAAAALGDDASGARGSRLDRVRQWMGPAGEHAHVVARGADSTARATLGTPPAILAAALPANDSTDTRGLNPRGDGIYLTTTRGNAGGSIEVWVPVDSSYLARTMRAVGGNARLIAQPQVFVGGTGLRIQGDTSWIARPLAVRYQEPKTIAGSGRPWFVHRLYLPAGSWNAPPTGEWRGAIELSLDATPRSLLRSTVRSVGRMSSNVFLLLTLAALGMLIGMIESFAVRSGRSILQAVLDEVGTLRKAAEAFGAGNLAYRLPVKGKDELSIVATSFNDMAASLERQREELVAAERTEEDLAVAREIQQRFLPQQAPIIHGLDVAGVSIPSREVGGDLFYWFTHDDGTLGFVLGDVSGKSIPAALLMSNVLAALRAQAIDRVDVAVSLARTNRLIIDQIEPGRFVTLFYGESDPARGELRYVSAGHNPPLLLRAGGELVWLCDGGVPLGVVPDASYQATTVAFTPGDTLIVYSDGVTEAEGPRRAAPTPGGESERQMFGEERLTALAGGLAGKPAAAALASLLEAVRGFAGEVEQADDITIVVVRCL